MRRPCRICTSEASVHISCGSAVAQLRLDLDRVVALGDADAVRHAQHMTIDRQPGHAERVAEHDVRRLAADARQRRQLLHVGRHLAAVLGDERCAMPISAFDFWRKKPVDRICGSSAGLSRRRQRRARPDTR